MTMSSNTSTDIYNTPAGVPPLGVTPNLLHPVSYLHTVNLFTTILCLAVSTLAVAVRVFTRIYVMNQFGLQDYALLVAQLGFIPCIALVIVVPGQGQHLWDISIYTHIELLKYANYITILYGPLLFFAKLSVLLQLQNIFVVSRRQPVFFIIQALVWSNLAFFLANLFIDIFRCVPRRKIWDVTVPGKCISMKVLLIAPAGINIVSDCLILVLPIYLVLRLQMSFQKKLAIVAIFSSGIFAVISSVMRLVYCIIWIRTTDTSWAMSGVALWAVAELTTVILAAAFPTLPRFWTYIRTGKRNVQEHVNNERRPAPCPSRKPRGPGHVQTPSSSEDNVPLKRSSMGLHDGSEKHREDLFEMQILKTETYEVVTQTRGSPENP